MECPVFVSGECLTQNADDTSPVNTFLIVLKQKLQIPRVKGKLDGIHFDLTPIAAVLYAAPQTIIGLLLEWLGEISGLCLFNQYHLGMVI